MEEIDLTQTHDVIGAYKSQNYEKIRKKYNDPGTRYAFQVLDQKILTSYPTKLAAFRHLQDLKRSELKVKGFGYHYDVKKCQALLNFASVCPDVDTGEAIELMLWQKFILCQLTGWRDSNNRKRFTIGRISVARGQGKTEIMAYALLIETLGRANQDLLVSSINFKQTNKIFGYIQSMLKALIKLPQFKELARKTGLTLLHDKVIARNTNNVLHEISHEGGQYDSFHFTLAIFDEVGEILTRKKISKITSGQVRAFNHQFIEISTAYPNPNAPFHDDIKKMIETMEQDYKRSSEQTCCLVWQQDELEETYKPETWEKSNPLLGLAELKDDLLNGLKAEREAQLMQGSLADFQNKNLNMWLQESTNSFLTLKDVEAAIIPEFDLDDRQVYLGFDYSMFSDNTAIGFVYPYQDLDDQIKFHIEQHSFIPWQHAGSLEAKEKQDGINYREQVDKGFCTITSHPDGLINDDQVYQWLINYITDHHLEVLMFGYDAYNMTGFIKQLELNTNWKLMPIRQRTTELKEPTKFLQKVFIEHSISRLDDPILEKSLINAEIFEDKIGIQVDKAKATYKIDVVDALIDSFYQAMFHFEGYSLANDPKEKVARMTAKQVKDWYESNYG